MFVSMHFPLADVRRYVANAPIGAAWPPRDDNFIRGFGPARQRRNEKALRMPGEDTPIWIVVSGGKYDYTTKWWDPQRCASSGVATEEGISRSIAVAHRSQILRRHGQYSLPYPSPCPTRP